MYRSEVDKLTDIVIGEAVLALLKEDAPVSGATLISRLNAMLKQEEDEGRQQALRRALSEVRQQLPAARRQDLSRLQVDNSNQAIMNDDGPPAGAKKH